MGYPEGMAGPTHHHAEPVAHAHACHESDHAGHPVAPAAATAAGARAGAVAEWTCPMHPEIRRPGPGSCPICGMALEPVMVTADIRPESGAGGHDAPVLGRRSR